MIKDCDVMDFLGDKHLQSLLYWLQFISAGAYIQSIDGDLLRHRRKRSSILQESRSGDHLSIHLMKFSISFSYWFLLILFFFYYFCWQSPSVRVYQPNSTRAKTFFFYSLNSRGARSIRPLKRKLYFPWEFSFSSSIQLFKCCCLYIAHSPTFPQKRFW